MDISERDKFRPENSTEDSVNYSHSMSSDWRFSEAILTSMPMGMVLPGNVDIVRNQDMVCSSSTAPLVDSFSPAIWEQAANCQNLGFGNVEDHNTCNTSNAIPINKGSGCPVSLSSGIDRTLDIGWNLSHSMFKEGVYLPNIPGVLLPSVSQLPPDSSFIERAARFSSFSGGNFSDVLDPFSMPESVAVFSRGMGMVPGRRDDFPRNGLNSVSGSGAGGQSQKNAFNSSEVSKAVSLTNEHGATERNPSQNESSLKLDNQGNKQGVDLSVKEPDEAEFSGGDGSGEPCMVEVTGRELSAKGLGSRKRKRSGQTELEQANGPLQQTSVSGKDNTDIQQKGDQPSSTTIKGTGKHGKQGSQPSDPSKEEYIHVRARRGQATNSHSLAERVRREKISERMKFLQELVPGCSKVTGKAVMLDEIINYVQSLQRQVEFLSMKLATVNPRLDINIEELLAKDILQSRAGTSSTLVFSPHMPVTCPPPRFSHHGLIPTSIPATASSEILRSTINSQLTPRSGGFKEPTQIKNSWDGELHNIVQMSFGTSAPTNCLEVDGSDSPSNTKVESST